MKALTLITLALALSFTAQASETEKTFTCKNASGTVVATEKKLSVFREVTLKHFDVVSRDNNDALQMPAKNSFLIYSSSNQGVTTTDLLLVNDLVNRKTLVYDHDKGGMDRAYILESYTIKAVLSLEGLSNISVDLDCVEETIISD